MHINNSYMNIISPLSLLIIPLLGSLLIIFYPELSYSSSIGPNKYNANTSLVTIPVSSLPSLRGKEPSPASSEGEGLDANFPSEAGLGVESTLLQSRGLHPSLVKHSRQPSLTNEKPNFIKKNELSRLSSNVQTSLMELGYESKIETKNSNLKKIAIITSLVNFFLSIII